MKHYKVESIAKQSSVGFSLNHTSHTITYPPNIWQSFPKSYNQLFADSIAYFFTRHLNIADTSVITYQFPPPATQHTFFCALLYAVPGALYEFNKANLKATNLVRDAYNSQYRTAFTGFPQTILHPNPFKPERKRVCVPFSFGKDSLLTYALVKELGYDPELVYILEPSSTFENMNKLKLNKDFLKKYTSCMFIDNPLGSVRQPRGLLWGWDALLTQYTLLLIPYMWKYRFSHILWSNEQSVNEIETTKDHYLINPTHEQGARWMLQLNNVLRTFSVPTIAGSILEPLHEIAILYILHTRYPDIGKYQLSCFNDHPSSQKKRWCGHCYECARVYLFMKALGIDPASVGFQDNMLTLSKASYHYLFDLKHVQSTSAIINTYKERSLAFFLLIKRKCKDPLVLQFQKKFGNVINRHGRNLILHFTRVYSCRSVPIAMRSLVLHMYAREMSRMRRQLLNLL